MDALFKDLNYLETEAKSTEAQISEIKLRDLRPNPYQPRQVFDEEKIAELAKSIRQSGVFQPIIVRKSKIKGYDIIAGERRFRASKLAEKETIPAIVRDMDDVGMMQVAVLENLQREDLSPLEEAEAYQMLMKNLGLTQAELSEKLGKSRSYIANYLRLLTLPAIVKQEVQKNNLSMGQARTLLGLKTEKAMLKLANRAIKESLTVRQIEKLVAEENKRQQKKQQKTRKALPPEEIFYQAIAAQLSDELQAPVKIQHQKNKGKIEINYTSEEELTKILDRLHFSLDKGGSPLEKL
jgi:ParB family chromosome partitioning protein